LRRALTGVHCSAQLLHGAAQRPRAHQRARCALPLCFTAAAHRWLRGAMLRSAVARLLGSPSVPRA
jgi:hypothetical protein